MLPSFQDLHPFRCVQTRIGWCFVYFATFVWPLRVHGNDSEYHHCEKDLIVNWSMWRTNKYMKLTGNNSQASTEVFLRSLFQYRSTAVLHSKLSNLWSSSALNVITVLIFIKLVGKKPIRRNWISIGNDPGQWQGWIRMLWSPDWSITKVAPVPFSSGRGEVPVGRGSEQNSSSHSGSTPKVSSSSSEFGPSKCSSTSDVSPVRTSLFGQDFPPWPRWISTPAWQSHAGLKWVPLQCSTRWNGCNRWASRKHWMQWHPFPMQSWHLHDPSLTPHATQFRSSSGHASLVKISETYSVRFWRKSRR